MARSHFSIVKSAGFGGLAAALVIFFGTYFLGSVSEYEAIDNLQEIRPTLRFTASAAMTASATILALMLTLLSFSQNTDKPIKSYHYDRIWWIARFAAVAFIGALILIMFLNVPITSAEDSLTGFYNNIYYALLVYAAVLGGMMIAIILLLYQATRDIILLAHPNQDFTNLYIENEDADGLTKREREAMVPPDSEEDKG